MQKELDPRATAQAAPPDQIEKFIEEEARDREEAKRGLTWRERSRPYVRSLRTDLRYFWDHPIGIIGVVIILLFGVLAILHPILMDRVWEPRIYDPFNGFSEDFTAMNPAAPSANHLLGTDSQGRDVLSQLMYSAEREFKLALIAAFSTVIIATLVGSLAAYYGGWLDLFFMRLADVIIMVPIISALAFFTVFTQLGPLQVNLSDETTFGLAIGLLSGFGATAVIIKSEALETKVKDFIEAARSAGASDWHILTTHIIPNVMPVALLYLMYSVTAAILADSTLSYFGLLKNVKMSWGIMISNALNAGDIEGAGFEHWWLILPAGGAITLLCAAFYMVGRAFDEVVAPRLQKR